MNMRISLLLLSVLSSLTASPLLAAITPAVVTVEAVQMPAWIERDGGKKTPVYAGMELRNRDQLRTGANSRLLLRTPDGSSVKLGENATFKLDDMPPRSGPTAIFKASMNVLEGAFRFTTDALAKFRGKRDVRIVFPTVTTGIRGTDLWGKSTPDRQVVCLIEGDVEVTPQGEQSIVMNQPLQFYIRDKGQSQPVAAVDPSQLKEWSVETDIAPGRGATRRGGHWKLTLATVDTQEAALKLYDDIREAGYPAQILPSVVEGDKHVYALRLTRLPSRAEAEALAATLKGRFGIEAPRVSL